MWVGFFGGEKRKLSSHSSLAELLQQWKLTVNQSNCHFSFWVLTLFTVNAKHTHTHTQTHTHTWKNTDFWRSLLGNSWDAKPPSWLTAAPFSLSFSRTHTDTKYMHYYIAYVYVHQPLQHLQKHITTQKTMRIQKTHTHARPLSEL